ncbi:MAG TPA: ATP-binding protein [Myxococcaceae bacterium]|nr:ATP-binding protein [Myxococcaceae bacterium]
MLITEERFEDTRRTVYYVLNELLRNVVQHSRDPLGGVVGAQVNRGGRNAGRPAVQVAVADAGIGIPASLQSRHASLTDPREALARSLWPHFSSAFDEGETGSIQNAGMGLFFIAEMTKLVGGRLVIASRGATLLLKGDEQFEEPHGETKFLEPGVGFPGTLVAFEMPSESEQDYDAMIDTIRERARERTPRRAVHKWLAFEEPPSEAQRFIVRQSRIEDTAEAQRFAEEKLLPRLFRREPVALDFGGIQVCTQSYVHSLLFEPLRLAWARKTKIYILNAQPAVRSTLELLENYALGG